ncbi:hypothetical protein L3Y34_005624 [Caenorhabditis briggsae]|uniref:Uncharacterized protein n=1 Tax=Caenorhabditis briggsae TaxID=6238 RepID=A0AAE9D6C4_CAEBR|nr:hypothetical protein L3Y34_005624 [Caenorhabditis briggsae]
MKNLKFHKIKSQIDKIHKSVLTKISFPFPSTLFSIKYEQYLSPSRRIIFRSSDFQKRLSKKRTTIILIFYNYFD